MRRREDRKTLLHKGLTTTVPAGSNTWALCVWCPRTRRQGLPRKAGKTPLVPQTGQSNSAELVEKCPLTTKHKVRNAVTTAEVKSPKLQTCDEQQPRGDWSHKPRDLDGSAGPRCTIARTTCETSAWKPLETRPHNNVSGARGVAAPVPRTGQCRHGWTQTEKQPGKGPQNPREGKRAQPTAGKRAQPTAGKRAYPTAGERTKATGDQTQCT